MQLFLRQTSLGRQSIDNMKFPAQSLVSGFVKWLFTKGAFECGGELITHVIPMRTTKAGFWVW